MLFYTLFTFAYRDTIPAVIEAYENFKPDQIKELQARTSKSFLKGLKDICRHEKDIRKNDILADSKKNEQKNTFAYQILYQKKDLKIFNEIADRAGLVEKVEGYKLEQAGKDIIIKDEKGYVLIKVRSGTKLFLK